MDPTLQTEERVSLALRQLYHQYGYRQYKVSKFEEYDLYAQNKNFLSSEQILTFSDTNGRLMALKPDITLSIIKNTGNDERTRKVWYTEHVYRVPRNAYGFQEITQTGLEYIGQVDLYAMSEVLMLAARSLETISSRYVLDLSHMGILTGILNGTDLSAQQSAGVLKAVGEKNLHTLKRLCQDSGLDASSAALLEKLCVLGGPAEASLHALLAMPLPEESRQAAQELADVCALLEGFGSFHIHLDLSVVNDMDYYNGIIFRGFVDGINDGVLSGGRYDNLLHKMGKSGSAIGFAVYLNGLERFLSEAPAYDVDTLLLYGPDSDFSHVVAAAKAMVEAGQTVRVQPSLDTDITYRRMIDKTDKEAD